MFKGFQKIIYPDYEVVCPQTHLSFNIRTLTVQEEERLKGSLLTPLQITEHLNKCIFECITKFPECILNEDETPNFDSFLKNVTIKDRDALLYGLYHVSYGEFRNYTVYCSNPECKKEYSINVNASDTFNYTIYPYQEGVTEHILSKIVEVPLKILDNVTINIKQPSLFDEIEAYKSIGKRPGTTNELIINTLPIVSIDEYIDDKKSPNTYSEKEDIIDAYKQLPSLDKQKLNKTYIEEFGKYGIELKVKSYCPTCGNEEIKYIDLVENFFSMVYGG
jgi:hypothetical protein